MRVLEVQNLVKHYGKIEALKGISFYIDEGEIFALIGPNGAGKSTTLRIIATLLTPTSGEVKVMGLDTKRGAEEIRKLISYLPEEAGAYRNLTGIEYLDLMAELYSSSTDEKEKMIKRAVEISDLGERIKSKTSTYSKGMTRKLLVARALMHNPKLAILDEPTSGLDVINSFEVRNIIKQFSREGVTVLLSSHNMLEVEFLSDRVAFIHEGTIIEQGRPEELKERYRARNLEEVFVEAIK